MGYFTTDEKIGSFIVNTAFTVLDWFIYLPIDYTYKSLTLLISLSGSQGPHSHILMTGGGGPSDFLGSEILAKSDFFGSMKDAGIFLGREKKQRDIFGLRKKN